MTIDTEEQLHHLKIIGKIVANCLKYMGQCIEPGMTTGELDTLGSRYLETHGARSAPQLTYGFPGATCISVNNQIAHGIPGALKIQAGDMVNIDVSAEKNGFFGDTGGSFIVPPSQPKQEHLCEKTREALENAIGEARAGQPLNLIGRAIERTAFKHNLSIIKNLGSHGVGGALHEEPKFIAPFFDVRDKRRLKKGMVITIEPFLSTGAEEAEETEDGWTLVTHPKYMTAQFEHTMVITDGRPEILTYPD